jgi:hypothetical protein
MMLEADQSYLLKNPSAMTRRTLLAALLALIMPKPPIPMRAPIPPTCEGMTTQILGVMQRTRIVDLSALFLCRTYVQNEEEPVAYLSLHHR